MTHVNSCQDSGALRPQRIPRQGGGKGDFREREQHVQINTGVGTRSLNTRFLGPESGSWQLEGRLQVLRWVELRDDHAAV